MTIEKKSQHYMKEHKLNVIFISIQGYYKFIYTHTTNDQHALQILRNFVAI